MKKALIYLLPILLIITTMSMYPVRYKEQYYKLYHQHMIAYPGDIKENIIWLEQALKARFANPLYAMAKIENETYWKHYKDLFMMHINIKLVDLYLQWANRYNKEKAYFYNYPWKEQNLESLEVAEYYMTKALFYWDEAVYWARQAEKTEFINLTEVQHWEDQQWRIMQKELDYADIITEHLERLQKVREDFEAMGRGTY